MRFRADAADAIGKKWHLFHGAPNAETFEAAQFGNLKIGVGDIAIIIQKDFDFAVAFKAGDRVNRYSLCHLRLLFLPGRNPGSQQGTR